MIFRYRGLKRQLNQVSAARVIDVWIEELKSLNLITDLTLRRIDRMLAEQPMRIAA